MILSRDYAAPFPCRLRNVERILYLVWIEAGVDLDLPLAFHSPQLVQTPVLPQTVGSPVRLTLSCYAALASIHFCSDWCPFLPVPLFVCCRPRDLHTSAMLKELDAEQTTHRCRHISNSNTSDFGGMADFG